jgi:para-aminobenzoate synthetase component 1
VGTVEAFPAAPSPLDALARVAGSSRPFLRGPLGTGFRGRPWSFLACEPAEDLVLAALPAGGSLRDALAPLRPAPVRRLGARVPFGGGWAGFVGYEARSGVERSPLPRPSPLGFPAVAFARYDAVLAWDHRGRRAYLAGLGRTERDAARAAAALRRRLRRPARSPARGALRGALPRARVAPTSFRAAVEAARRAVLRGDVFQTNVSQRFDARWTGSAVDLFRRLAEAHPAPYMTYVGLGGGRHVLSASPERFVRVVGRVVETDPMKGTRPRGVTPAEDRRLREELESSEKERAELAMIVDLSRNDLARVCRVGTVRVTVPRRVVSFRRVHQAIAVVRGRLEEGRDVVDLLQAAFPPGSVTGAPKVRAMEVLDALEGEGRGPYCGALGWVDAEGDADLAVGIRTVLLAGRTATYRVGGGITLRSEPVAEWRETLDKGRGLFAALAGREDVA